MDPWQISTPIIKYSSNTLKAVEMILNFYTQHVLVCSSNWVNLREFWLKMTTLRFHKSKITVVANIDKQDPWMKGHQIRDWNLQRSKIVTIFSRSIRTVQFLPFPWSKKMATGASEVKPKLRCQVPPHELFFSLFFSFYVPCTRQVSSTTTTTTTKPLIRHDGVKSYIACGVVCK